MPEQVQRGGGCTAALFAGHQFPDNYLPVQDLTGVGVVWPALALVIPAYLGREPPAPARKDAMQAQPVRAASLYPVVFLCLLP